MTDKLPSDIADKFVVRLPDGLRDKLKLAAKANGRTMNAEVVARVETSFSPAVPEGDPVARAVALADALERIARAAETIARHQPGVESFPT